MKQLRFLTQGPAEGIEVLERVHAAGRFASHRERCGVDPATALRS